MSGYPQPPTRVHTDVLGARIAAQIIDSIVMLAVMFIPAIGFSVLNRSMGLPSDTLSTAGVVIGIGLYFGYWLFLEGLWDGYTVGKKIVGIKVVKEDGSECQIGASVIRNLLEIIDGLVYYIPGLITIAVSDKRQRIGDHIAGTVVVREHQDS